MKYADIKECDIANGPGIRVSLFVSGCFHHCPGCFNSEAWDFRYGNDYTKEVEDKVVELLKRPYISGLSLLGGDPLVPDTQRHLAKLVKRVREELPNKSIWCYTGYMFEKEIMAYMYNKLPQTNELLNNIDVLIDGRWDQRKYDPGLIYRGSSNQRIIDIPKTIENDMKVVLWDMEYGR